MRPEGPRASIALIVLAAIASVLFMREARGLLIPIVLALLVACAVAPVVGWLDRVRVPRWAGAGLVVLALAGVAVGGALMLGGQLVTAAGKIPEAAARLREGAGSNGVLMKVKGALDAVEQLRPGKPPVTVTEGGPSATSVASHVTAIFFLVYFLLLTGDRFALLIEKAAGRPANRKAAAETLGDIYRQIRRFLMVQLFTSSVVAVCTFVMLALIGVEQAAFWAVLAGLANTIPYFGPVVISAGLAVVALLQFGSTREAVWVSGGALAITSLEGWLLSPPLMGRAERMNVLAVFIGLLVWSWIWGVWGTILAVPMLAVLKAVCDHVEAFHPLGALLGELPPARERTG